MLMLGHTPGPACAASTPEHPCRAVLLVEDHLGDARLIRALLTDVPPAEFCLEWVDHLAAGLERLAIGGIDVVLLDLGLPDSDGLATFAAVRARAPAVPVVVLSGLADEHLAEAAVRAGAQDYLVKGRVDGEALGRSLRYATERARLLAREQAARAAAECAEAREQQARRQAETANAWLALLAEVSAQLAGPLEVEASAARLAELLVPALGDLCVVLLAEGAGVPARAAAVRHVDPAKEAVARELLAAYPPGPGDALGVGAILGGHPGQVLPEVPDHLLAHVAVDERHLELLYQLGPRSCLWVPLAARDHLVGALGLVVTESDRRLSLGDLGLLEVVAGRAALALDNIRLHQALQRALQARQLLLASVSHDLASPLTAIQGFARLLRQQVARGALEADPVLQGLDRIDRSAAQMGRLVGELLDVAHLEAGRPLALRPQPADLVGIARAAVAEHQERSGGHRLRCEASVPQLVGRWDGARLERVLDNLLSNAVKYSPEGSAITGRLTQVEDAAGALAVLVVRDTGVGIPADDLTHLFEPFHRAGNVRGRAAGSGLGLWGSRRIVEQHGGTIVVESREGRGTTVTLRLPLPAAGAARHQAALSVAVATRPAEAGQPAVPARSHPARVLVVEDDPATRDLLRHLLADAGYAVRTAANGFSGLRLAQADPPEVLLLDLGLAERRGVELLRELKEDARTASIPVIVVSSAAVDLADEDARRTAARVPKPFVPAEVLRLVEQAVAATAGSGGGAEVAPPA